MGDDSTLMLSLDEIIRINKTSSDNNSVGRGSHITSVSYQSRGGFSRRNGIRQVPLRPLDVDWTWTKEGGSLASALPKPHFYRGLVHGQWSAKGQGYGFRRPQNRFMPFQKKNQRFVVTMGGPESVFTNSTGFRYPYHHNRFRSQTQRRLPVHQRLGWFNPAQARLQNIARNRVKLASWFLNRRRNFNSTGQYQPKYVQNMPSANMMQRRQMRQNALSNASTNGEMTVSVVNERAVLRPQALAKGNLWNQNSLSFVAPLSRQNVALLPNGTVCADQSARSFRSHQPSQHSNTQSFRSQAQPYRNNAANKRFRHTQNRAWLAQPQLEAHSPMTPSLASLRNRLNVIKPGAVTAASLVHRVRLDQKLQAEIRNIQGKAEAAQDGVSGTMSIDVQAFDYRPVAKITTTSISDRFSVLT